MLQRNMSNRFANVAQSVDIPRSNIPVSFKWHTTGNVGTLYPMCRPIEVLPGDGFQAKTANLTRMVTPLVPVMDSAYIDTFWFFVPMRLTWKHTKQFFGESEVAGFDPESVYSIPTLTASSEGFAEKSLPDFYGVPTKVPFLEISALQFRAYRLIWNNFFRDQNIQDTLLVNDGDTEGDITLLQPLKVNKFHDYFTSALPYPQKGPDVLLPISGTATVRTSPTSLINDFDGTEHGLMVRSIDGEYSVSPFALSGTVDWDTRFATIGVDDNVGDATAGGGVFPVNLYADLDRVNSATIIQLRQAFAVQKLYENFALHGSRYYEMIRGSFGVVAPEAYLQIPEYLGGARHKINMSQVIQTSSSVDNQALGSAGAFSLTTLSNQDFDKTFVEHGWLIPLYCIRNINSYQQGLERQWSRRDMLDFYFPELANIGEQAVLNKEIYAQGTDVDDEVFGYQERYAEYRYFSSMVTGEFRSNADQSLDVYHYADNYDSLPTLSSTWLQSDPVNVDRTLSIPSTSSDQFYCDFEIQLTMQRKMPLFGGHSIQGWM